MNNGKIYFHTEGVNFTLKNKRLIRNWLNELVSIYDKSVGELNYIFCSDAYLLEINQNHLKHDYFTDIITFDYCENKLVSGDLFISIERVRENAKTFGKTQNNELHRVIAHGLLHLLGFKDKSSKDANQMKEMEEVALELYIKLNN